MGKRQEAMHGSVAVIGSGISGLATALALAMRGSRKVTVFEAEDVCGGHTLTDTTSEPGVPIDLGFQVFNLTTYPHLQGMFEMLGVDSEPSEMSFSLSVDGGALEWGSNSLFAQKSNAVSPRFLKMLIEVLRFGREAPKVLQEEQYSGMALGEYLEKHGYSESFKTDYLLPMCAAVWSVPSRQVLAFPVQMLIRFWVNHHLLDVMGRPCWRVVKGRSKSYVDEILERLKVCGASVRMGAKVVGVERCKGRLVVSYNETRRGLTSETLMDTFDEVVLATHSDVSLKILSKGREFSEMTEVLAKIPYSYNDVYLHTDTSLMPTRREAWASWNCVEARSGAGSGVPRARSSESSDTSGSSGPGTKDILDAPVCVTYWANRLQDLSNATKDYFVTLNPVHAPQPSAVLRKMVLAHPIFGEASVEAQRRLSELQGRHGVYLCGAWCGYGFHEDGIRSAVAVLEALRCPLPWTPSPVCSPKIGIIDTIAMKVFDKFAKTAITVGRLRLILPNGKELVYGTPAPPVGGEAEAWRDRPPLNATVRIYDVSFFRKIIARHDTGLGESYMDGDFEVIEGLSGSGDLGSLMAVITGNAHSLEANRGIMGVFNMIGDTLLTWAHARRSNSAAGSRRNIEEHYDAGNMMYKAFLDDTMTYSCGVWRKDSCGDGSRQGRTGARIAPSLQEAQFNKLDALIRKADIREGHKVLEIGCGWGSLAMRAASTTGCHVVGLTLSKEQLAEATQRVKDAGLEDKITLLYCDYRDTPDLGSYDRVVSCEMIEAVGHEHLPAYFATIGAALKPGGKCAIQVIAAPDYRYEEYCGSSDFIREHIFPGGHLPSMGACVDAARGTGLSVHASDDIGADYAVTLRKWREAWEAKKDYIISKLGYSERFWKKYRFYFVYCEAGFDAKYIHTFQVTWVKDGEFTLSDAQLQEALELSKGGNVSCGVSRRKSSLGWAVSITLSTVASVTSALSSLVWSKAEPSKLKAA
jgi:cyclopropane-fatty-acyl-phospholipid synthase